MDSVPSDNSGGAFSPRSSEPPSLNESMQLMNDIADTTIDRLARLDKLETLMSAAILLPSEQVFFFSPNFYFEESFYVLFFIFKGSRSIDGYEYWICFSGPSI